MSRDPSVFSRWSERKRAVAAEAEAEEERKDLMPDPAGLDIKNAPEAVDVTEEEILEKLGLPDPETMQKGDDFAAFLKDGVPEALKKRALRTLWRSNPVLANLDGLVDHGEDYTDAAMVPETMKTLYQVGKGMLRKVVEPAEGVAETEAEPAEFAQAAETNGINQEPAGLDEVEPACEDDMKDASDVNMKSCPEQTETEQENPYAPRRMAFRCD